MSIRKGRSARSGRAPLPSPGRPPVAGRDEQIRYWRGSPRASGSIASFATSAPASRPAFHASSVLTVWRVATWHGLDHFKTYV